MPVAYRPAALDDAAEIHTLLLGMSDEIPLLLDTLEREEALYTLIRTCARSGESWVAVDDGRIVGVVLAERAERGRHYAEHEIIELHHAGVAPAHRDRGVFTALIGKVKDRMVPIVVTVPAQNRAGAAGRLERRGFHPADPGGTNLRWDPGARRVPGLRRPFS